MWTGGNVVTRPALPSFVTRQMEPVLGNGKIRPSDADVGVEEYLAQLPARLRGQRPEHGLDGLAVDRLQ